MCNLTIVTSVAPPYSTECFDQPECSNRGFDVEFILNVLTILGCKIKFLKVNFYEETLDFVKNRTANLTGTIFAFDPKFLENFRFVGFSNDSLIFVTKKFSKIGIKFVFHFSRFSQNRTFGRNFFFVFFEKIGGKFAKFSRKFLKFLQEFFYFILGILICGYSTILTLKITQEIPNFDFEIKKFENLVDAISIRGCKIGTTADYLIDEIRKMPQNFNKTNPFLAERLQKALEVGHK